MTHQDFIDKYNIRNYKIVNNILEIDDLDLENNQLKELTIPEGCDIDNLYLNNNQLKEFTIPKGCDIDNLYLSNNQLKEFTIPEGCKIDNLNLFPESVNFINYIDIANKILQNKLEDREIFNIEDIEIKRVAYKYLDKTKLLDLENYRM